MDIGDRDADTFKKFYEKIKYKAKLFYTDKWKLYEDKLVQSKKYTYNYKIKQLKCKTLFS